MANQPNDGDKRGSFFCSAAGIVTLSVILLLASMIAAGIATTANVAVARDPQIGPTGKVILSYLYYVPAYLFGVAGAVGLIIGAVRWAMFGRSSVGVSSAAAQADTRVLDLLQLIANRMLISDTAKRITYREQDREALRQAIREDIDKNDYEAALVLINEMSAAYGYREEAEVFREEVLKARAADQARKLAEAIRNLDAIIKRCEWDKAFQTASKVERLFPEAAEARDLVKRVMAAREQHKHNLEREFLAASERDDVDRAMELLKELDKHLTEAEAAPFLETARGIIGKKRDNLGVQFKMAVHDKEWTNAVRVGEQIIREFPNTKMSDEVRGMLDLLRERAAGEQAARPREWAQ